MNVLQKDIVLVEYPFSDLTRSKLRPALVLSNNYFNTLSDDCVAVPLTSVLKDVPYSVIIHQGDMAYGELLTTSRIRIDKLFSVEKRLIVKKLGTLTALTFEKIKTIFASIV